MDNSSHKSSRLSEPEFDMAQLVGLSDERDAVPCFNKSLDMGRHSAALRRGKKAGSGLNRSKDNLELCGDSYATMGDSFMGESFANMGEHSFAVSSIEDSFDYSDSEHETDLEIKARNNHINRPDLTTVLDLEEEEDELEGLSGHTTDGRESKK